MRKEKKVAYIYVTKETSIVSSASLFFSFKGRKEQVCYYPEDNQGEIRELKIEEIVKVLRLLFSEITKEESFKFLFNHELSWEMDKKNKKPDPHSIGRKVPLSENDLNMVWEALWKI